MEPNQGSFCCAFKRFLSKWRILLMYHLKGSRFQD